MKSLRDIMRKTWTEKKGPIQQCLDYVSALTVGSTVYATYWILQKQWTTSTEAQRKYVLVGNENLTNIVEKRIRYKMGEPGKPLWLFKSKFTEIVKTTNLQNVQGFKNETKPIDLCLCITGNGDHSKDSFGLPTDKSNMPANIDCSIVVVKDTKDNPEDVENSVHSLDAVTGIKENFDNTKVMQFSSDNYKDVDYKTEVTLRTFALYVVAIILLAVRKGVMKGY